MTATPNPCPAWCDGDHPSGWSGVVHRGEIGRANVGGETVIVVILKSPEGPASVTISGPVYVEIHNDDHDDMVRLLTLAGQTDLAALVERAATILREAAL
ncbi:hypothetical protein F8568_017640 [Actinomadura sp. LD22]|uniref:Uncharacterized protein n=1 Tax=Actinomadura physcomitrii TaxID=2650748 RepID=A0A6I4MD10_9ACTN|nr:hypothetical protein [Actinomadura physcomitrii]MWA02164.1 hypothetical protein [Actinomadura physcomitrii]